MVTLGYFDRGGRPRMLIEIEYQNTRKQFDALVDSGADKCLLPKRAGFQLGLKLPTKATGYSTGVGGHVPIKHIILETKLGLNKLKLKFAWLYTCDDVPVVIGRKGIFDRFNFEIMADWARFDNGRGAIKLTRMLV